MAGCGMPWGAAGERGGDRGQVRLLEHQFVAAGVGRAQELAVVGFGAEDDDAHGVPNARPGGGGRKIGRARRSSRPGAGVGIRLGRLPGGESSLR